MTEQATTTSSELDTLVDALRSVIQAEVSSACAGAGSSGADPDAIVDQLIASEKMTAHINTCLEQGLRNVLPQFIGRLKQELGGGGGGGGGNATEVVNSNEMKEMLEERFRTMVHYLKADVLPREIKKVTGQ